MVISILGTRGGIGATTLLSNLYSFIKSQNESLVWFSLTDPFPPLFSLNNLEWEKLYSFKRNIPEWNYTNCNFCNCCVQVCVNEAIAPFPEKHLIYSELCNSCRSCISSCKHNALEFQIKETGYIKKMISDDSTILKIKLFGREILSQWYLKETFTFLKSNYQSEKFKFIDIPSGYRELWPDIFKLSDIVIVYTDDPFVWELIFKSHSPRQANLILAVTQKTKNDFLKSGYQYAIPVPYNKEITRTTIQGSPSQDFDFTDSIRKIYHQINVIQPNERSTTSLR